ncbi:MAG: hypothetical protein B7733_17830 [Myxococcales bacterium FL481]|nr:MAG: hypothetical protein B7733_17830 [Myxococcales bacterium FL481]
MDSLRAELNLGPVADWSLVATWVVGLFLYAWWLGRDRSVVLRWAGVLAAAAGPFMLPPAADPARMYLCGYAVVFAAKIWERGANRVADPRCWNSPARFVVWWLLPPDHRWPMDAEDARANRRRGRRRLVRGGAAAGLFVGMLGLAGQVDVHGTWLGSTAWALLVIYGFIAAIADVGCGLVMLTGLDVVEVFRNPVLARSPNDFWANRWNRYINGFARRHIFFPWVDRLGMRGAAGAVFLASGLMHEYLVVAWQGGWGSYTGWTTAFFVVQGFGVLVAHSRVGAPRWRRPLAVGAHILWMMVTVPLFFAPLDEAIGFLSWRI